MQGPIAEGRWTGPGDVFSQHNKCPPAPLLYAQTPPPLCFPTPGKTVPYHSLGDGHQVTPPPPPPPPGEPHYYRTRTFAGTEIAA